MRQKGPQPLTRFGRIARLVSGIALLLFVVCVVVWQDSKIDSFLQESFQRGSLFHTQDWHRNYRSLDSPELDADPDEPAKWYPIWMAIMRYEAHLSIGLLAASAGMVFVNLVRQLDEKRVWRDPGAVACLTAIAATSLCVVEEIGLAAKGMGIWGSRYVNPFPNAWPNYELYISFSVLGAWVTMIGLKRWRPRRSWADRVGVAIGVLWLLVLMYRIINPFFIPFANWGY